MAKLEASVVGGMCKGCKHWGTSPELDEGEMHTYDGRIPAHWRLCLRTYREWWGDDRPDGALMIVSGYEFEGLATAPEFGCIEWQPKEQG